MITVPNKHPTIHDPSHRLAIIGEAPGKDEVETGEPFVGRSGRFLANLLAKHGLPRECCFIGNVCQHQPPKNEISCFAWDGPEITEGIAKLKNDLERFKPNCILLLGNIPLKLAKDPVTVHKLEPKFYEYKNHVWRGSTFTGNVFSPCHAYKCLSTYHPAYVLRDYSVAPLLDFDIKRAVEESTSMELNLSVRVISSTVDFSYVIRSLSRVIAERPLIAIDIEGGIDSMSCISIATSPHHSFIVPFFLKDGRRAFQRHEEIEVWRLLSLVLADPFIPKVLQNCLYDTFVLHYSYKICVRGVVDDTMLKHWEKYCEIKKSLAVQTSIYTKEPYYKGDRHSDSDETFFRYCCMDSAVTHEINSVLVSQLKPTQEAHYRFNMGLLLPLRYMEMRGIRYNSSLAAERRALLRSKMFEAQANLNALTGHGFSWSNLKEIKDHVNNLMGYSRQPTQTKAPYLNARPRMVKILGQANPNLATIGEVEDLCETSLNVSSDTQLQPYLYETLKLPVQYNENANGIKVPTADYEALLNLSKHCQKTEETDKYQIIQLIIEIRSLATRQQMLAIKADGDGRIRCGYNIAGSEKANNVTGRITTYTSPTGSGYNLQAIPNYTNLNEAPGKVLGDRDLFIADEDYFIFECDLEGADGWTVAAYCAMLGDRTMLDDYQYGLRPAKILALMMRGVKLNYNNRSELKDACKAVSKDDWDYFACKRVQHGASYMEGPITIGRNILKDSEGKLFWDQNQCKHLKNLFFQRYWGIPRWHSWVGNTIAKRPVLVAASGNERIFFGRPEEILTTAVAHEPQHNTTYAIKMTMKNLWQDPENRDGQKLLVEPLHCVHDSLVGQFHKSRTEWAVAKIRQWFYNPIKIAGTTLVIPFEGGYGSSWAAAKAKTVGVI